jgi:hypothetical protein
MSKECASKKRKDVQKLFGWQQALQHTEKSLADAKARVRELNHSVRAIKRKIEEGEPFPMNINADLADHQTRDQPECI